jgi:ABC-type nickel/cobalt efflux system permease component RcnA
MRWASSFLLSIPLLFCGASALAHPMGNFSVNHYSKIKIGPQAIEILYLVDMAEIPTYQEMRRFGVVAGPDNSSTMLYLAEQQAQLGKGLSVQVDGQSLALTPLSSKIDFAEGAGGLPTMKLAFVFRGNLDAASDSDNDRQLSYSDNNFPARAGWKEIVVANDGISLLRSTAPEMDRSHELTNYSTDLLNSPPQQLSAQVGFRSIVQPSGSSGPHTIVNALREKHFDRVAAAAVQANHPDIPRTTVAPVFVPPLHDQLSSSESPSPTTSPSSSKNGSSQNTPRSRFTQLIATQNRLGFWVLLSAAFIAAGLGALHALEPGHGKTIVAAYLVGSRGTARHAVLLGFVVTASHTAGVYLLGLITLYASRYIVPDHLYPWLGAISGLSVTALGIFAFLRHLTGESGEHSHAPGKQHSHWFLSMFRRGGLPEQSKVDFDRADGDKQRSVSLRELFVLGITGGIVPCPAALVVLLSAFSLHRIGFGLFLITAFSLGLAAVLVIVGLCMVYAKRFMAQRMIEKHSVVRYLPILSSVFMMALGVGIAVSAFVAGPIGSSFLPKEKLLPFITITLLGLFLGMRHSTDPDHVVAVSTIVTRQQSVKSSAAIGLLWGLGHTITIFLVGSAIIVFGVVIPPRLGLSMEFCVALMLILLGILNLTGVMRWITERLTPARSNSLREASWNVAPNGGKAQARKRRTFLGKSIEQLGIYQSLRPLIVGLVHGLAGSAAVALLVLSTIKNPFWSTIYLLVFGLGTMAGMMLMTAAISAPLVFAGQKFFNVNRHLTTISGLASVAFGMFLVYHIGFIDGLFTSHVHWIPQ